MPADRFIAADGSVRWHIYGDGLEGFISDAMYQDIQRHADQIREAGRRKELGHPLFNGEIGIWNGVAIARAPRALLVGKPGYDILAKQLQWKRDPHLHMQHLAPPKPWLLPDGQHVGAQRLHHPIPHHPKESHHAH